MMESLPLVSRYRLRVSIEFDPPRLEASARMTLRNDGPSVIREVPFLLNRLLSAEGSVPTRMEDLPSQEVSLIRVALPSPLPPGGEGHVDLTYHGEIGGYEETGMLYLKDRLDPAFTILRSDAFAYPVLGHPSHAWLRSHGWARFGYEAEIRVPAGYVVANGGRLRHQADGIFVFENVLPAWRMDFAVAEYGVLEDERARVYHFPQDREGAEFVLDAVARVLHLYEDWFGPLRLSVPFAVIEVPDGWGSQADVTSVLQSAAAFHSPDRMVELYHEISHLWNVEDLDRPSPRWNEGLACFLQNLAAEHIEGRPRLESTLSAARQDLLRVAEERPEVAQVPMLEYGERRLTDLSYSVGMLMFAAIHERVGAGAFRRALGEIYRGSPEGTTTERMMASFPGCDSVFREWMLTTNWLTRLQTTETA